MLASGEQGVCLAAQAKTFAVMLCNIWPNAPFSIDGSHPTLHMLPPDQRPMPEMDPKPAQLLPTFFFWALLLPLHLAFNPPSNYFSSV